MDFDFAQRVVPPYGNNHDVAANCINICEVEASIVCVVGNERLLHGAILNAKTDPLITDSPTASSPDVVGNIWQWLLDYPKNGGVVCAQIQVVYRKQKSTVVILVVFQRGNSK